RPEVPQPVVAVLERMLAKKPGDRFGTPGEAAAALEPHAAVIPGPDSSLSRPLPSTRTPIHAAGGSSDEGKGRRAGKRSYWRLGVGAGLAALLLLAGTWAAYYFRGSPSRPGGGDRGEVGQPIKVGILHSRTGTMAISEKPVVDATLFAIEELNAKGGV